jgi:hypothetical protein
MEYWSVGEGRDLRSWIPNVRCGICDAGCAIRDIGCKMEIEGRKFEHRRCSIFVALKVLVYED